MSSDCVFILMPIIIMKRFISTKFFRILKDKTQKDDETGIKLLESSYEKFVKLLFAENDASMDKVSWHNTLAYTLVELSNLTEVSEKKRRNSSSKSYSTHQHTA